MKRNNLTTALLAGLAGAAGLASTASAVSLNPDGLGQVLIYPYYTVNAGNQTLVSVVNTTDRVKAVKVRFLEGRNSKEVLDFNLYLSPFDVWTGAVFATGSTGPGNLLTLDTSCTVPQINGNASLPSTNGIRYAPFRNFAYVGTSDHPASTNATLNALERTREGHLEIIEMGLLQDGPASTQLAEEATHVENVPDNCGAIRAAWAPTGPWTANGTLNIDLPTGGLFGSAEIVDVANGTALSYNADAIEGFYTVATAPGFLHSNPGSTFPALRDAETAVGVATSFIFNAGTGTVVSETFPRNAQPNAVSLLYQHDAIMNEYNTEAGFRAESDWVITFPTKRYYVNGSTPIAPFTTVFPPTGQACEPVAITYWNREEDVPGPGETDFSPPQPGSAGPTLCFEAQVITFNQASNNPSGVLGSTYALNVNTAGSTGAFVNGWARFGFTNAAQVLTGPTTSTRYQGLPATGFWAVTYVNTAAQPGLLANFAGTHRHRASRAVAP